MKILNNVYEFEFNKLKKQTLQIHTVVRNLQGKVKESMSTVESLSILTEIDILRKTCYSDLDKLQLLGLHFMNKLQYIAVGQAIQKLKREIE